MIERSVVVTDCCPSCHAPTTLTFLVRAQDEVRGTLFARMECHLCISPGIYRWTVTVSLNLPSEVMP
jgi:hypothetical protein